MTHTDLYGFKHNDLEEARGIIQRVLDINLEPHESLYFGVYYFGSLPGEQSVHLRRNLDPLHDPKTDPPEEHFAEPKFQDSPLLLYVSGSGVDAIRQQLERRAVGISFLRRE